MAPHAPSTHQVGETMSNNTRENKKVNRKIDKIDVTTDTITGRGGLSLFVRYLDGIKIGSHLDRLFGTIRKSRKGLPICEVFKQLICFFVDGTSRHLVYFDHLRGDAGYAAVIETAFESMISSHAIKRFLRSFWFRGYFCSDACYRSCFYGD